jgi:hypothetical protein
MVVVTAGSGLSFGKTSFFIIIYWYQFQRVDTFYAVETDLRDYSAKILSTLEDIMNLCI